MELKGRLGFVSTNTGFRLNVGTAVQRAADAATAAYREGMEAVKASGDYEREGHAHH